jgi:hypothetical protein
LSRWWIRIAAGLAAVVSLWLVPYDQTAAAFPLCGFHWLTGLKCPLCGMTRALSALLHGHPAQALQLNALSPLAAAILAALLIGVPSRRIPWRTTALLFATFGLARIVATL